MPARRNSFYRVVSDAVADMAARGFDMERLEAWMLAIHKAAYESLTPRHILETSLKDALGAIYRRLVERGQIAKFHQGIGRFTIEQLRPKLRTELENRIMASANLIRLNREEAIGKTLQRFSGWASSVPPGGTQVADKVDLKVNIRKAMTSLPFEERRVLIDQGHKFATSLSDIIARDGGAIVAQWHHHHVTYPRPEHVEREGSFWLIRNSWAHQAGLVKPQNAGQFTDRIEQPGEFVLCRCVIGETQIAAPQIKLASRRHYHGPILKLILSGVTESPLTLTPNHPVLTSRGWIAANDLKLSDDLAQLREENILPAMRDHDIDQGISTIEQIFGALSETGTVHSVRDSRENFHGDGGKCDVNIVSAAGTLALNSEQFAKSGGHLNFTETDGSTFGFSPIRKMFFGLWLTAYSGLRQFDIILSDMLSFFGSVCSPKSSLACAEFLGPRDSSFFSFLGVDNSGSFGFVADRDPDSFEATANSGIRDFELLCKFHGIDARKISFAKIAKIERNAFSGHVYNLETEGEWYVANGTITHNCTYSYRYALRDLPEEMLTAKGKAELRGLRVA